MKSIIYVLITLNKENKVIEIKRKIVLTLNLVKLKIAILIEEHDYFYFDSLAPNQDTQKYIKNQNHIFIESIQDNNEILKEDIDLIIAFNYIENDLVDNYISKILTKTFTSALMKLVSFHTMPLLIVKIKEQHKSFMEKIFLK